MDNKQVLDYILITDGLLNDLGNATRMDKDKRWEAKEKINEAKAKIQRSCYDPYLFASTYNNQIKYTCLVCGKVIDGTTLGHVINLVDGNIIEGDILEEYMVSRLKNYLTIEPALSEEDIREALRKDLLSYINTRQR